MSNEKLQAVYQRNVTETSLIIKRLTERNQALEQLCKALHGLLYAAPLDMGTAHHEWDRWYDAVQKQYEALLEQEVK